MFIRCLTIKEWKNFIKWEYKFCKNVYSVFNDMKLNYRVKKGIVIKWLIMSRKKRASSQRKVVKMRCKVLTKDNRSVKTRILYSYIRGYTSNKRILREYSLVLIIRKGKSDINLVYNRVIRGKLDCETVINRKTNRSNFCIKKRFYRVKLNYSRKCQCFKCLIENESL